MNTLLHPATAFIQSLPYNEVAYKNLTPLQQRGIWEYMYAVGEGIWADDGIDTVEAAVERCGDIHFGVGSFVPGLKFKEAMKAASEDIDEEVEVEEWYRERYACIGDKVGEPQPPVIMSSAEMAPDLGLFEWGYEWFYSYWTFQSLVEFVCFLHDEKTDAQ